jgi:hypothetical protein
LVFGPESISRAIVQIGWFPTDEPKPFHLQTLTVGHVLLRIT